MSRDQEIRILATHLEKRGCSRAAAIEVLTVLSPVERVSLRAGLMRLINPKIRRQTLRARKPKPIVLEPWSQPR